ncbi:hypothetical protein LOK49_LG09G01445 [Camellia lanceoleosa]|uniref:Uncharacterized protein n=1 Tax=Camellia lanceoleosa TaxID=1840588 RepID=A0ACC0GIP5_9ERIC|nr:hypothetical protein LOK49_LG09G01445 [Camellia lanceoleosa]
MPTMHLRSEEEFPHAHNEEATIVYQLQGRQAEFQCEKTSLSTSLNEDFAMEFSSFDSEDNCRAMEHLATLRIFKGSSYVVDELLNAKCADSRDFRSLIVEVMVKPYKEVNGDIHCGCWTILHFGTTLRKKKFIKKFWDIISSRQLLHGRTFDYYVGVCYPDWCSRIPTVGVPAVVRIEKSHISCIADSIFNGASAVL